MNKYINICIDSLLYMTSLVDSYLLNHPNFVTHLKPLALWILLLDTLPNGSATTKLIHRFSATRCALIQGLIPTCRSLSEAVWRMTTQGIMPSCSWSDKASPNQHDVYLALGWHWMSCFSGHVSVLNHWQTFLDKSSWKLMINLEPWNLMKWMWCALWSEMLLMMF